MSVVSAGAGERHHDVANLNRRSLNTWTAAGLCGDENAGAYEGCWFGRTAPKPATFSGYGLNEQAADPLVA
ncbi:hypothetical protein [Roseimaritima ulvae]|uniref:hypothetical protein n=1 Tax=Roseimaritima ulvae TaxID=980254 RepID=UPI0012F85C42|nr:hypothetical protein [Roseimaritima ulvae]